MRGVVAYVSVALGLGSLVGGSCSRGSFDRDSLSAEELTDAVRDEVGTAPYEPCEPRSAARWICHHWDPGQSGDARDYRVVVREDGCWAGRIIGSATTTEGPMPKTAEGCL